MKQATGELNSTVIVVISVGVLMTFFFSYLWPMINSNFKKESDCDAATCNCSEEIRNANDGFCLCTHKDVSNGEEQFKCVYKG